MKVLALVLVFLAGTAWARAANTATEDVKQQYRAYLQQLKALNQQYKQITGQIAEVVKEEGLPTWQSSPAEAEIAQMAAKTYGTGDAIVRQTDKEIRVYLELPGLLRNSMKVSLDNGQTLHVTGQKRVADELSTIDRTVSLPVVALEKGAKAKYNDGILEVTLPKGTPQQAGIPVN